MSVSLRVGLEKKLCLDSLTFLIFFKKVFYFSVVYNDFSVLVP